MTIAEAAGLVAVTVAVASVLLAVGRFIESVKANTTATEKLSLMIDGHLRWSEAMAREVTERLHSLNTRVTVLEAKEDK